jgi:hypothetical protein
MKKRMAILLFVFAATMLWTGCGSGSGQGGGSTPQAAVYTKVSTGNWPTANVYGQVDPTTITCTPSSDQKCITNFPAANGSATTNSYGEYIFSTDALPGYWSVGAKADSNCPNGGSGAQQITNNGSITIYCGSFYSGIVSITPISCWIVYNSDGSLASDGCDGHNVTLSMQESILPTTYALNVSNYDDTATELSSASPTSSNGTSVVVPSPTDPGQTVLVITDPVTNQVLGAGLFTVRVKQL